MREIKFRGWFQGINGQEFWVYGYLVKQINGNWEITNGETSWTVDSVGQFTGLKDKSGKEIYEGDILRDLIIGSDCEVVFGSFSTMKDYWGIEEISPKFCVLWSDKSGYSSIKSSNVEIKGNIYENNLTNDSIRKETKR